LFTDAVTETFVTVSFLSCLDNNGFATGKAAGKHDYYFTTLKAVSDNKSFGKITNVETIIDGKATIKVASRNNSHSHFKDRSLLLICLYSFD
jgi:hypothetical protein